MEEAKRWYDSPGYVAVRQHRMRGAKYLGLLVDGGVTESIDERMPQSRRKSPVTFDRTKVAPLSRHHQT